MALSDVKIDWQDKAYLAMVERATEQIIKEGAERVAEEAARNLERMAPDSTGTLASQIEVKASKFAKGGYVVIAQGTGNYNVETTKKGTPRPRWYASFVELGTRKMAGLGYLRKALRRNRYWMRRELANRLEAQIRE